MTLTDKPNGVVLMRAQAEAAAWMAVLHSPGRNPTIEEGLRRWISADPVHAAVWEVATDLWNESAGLPRRIPRRISEQPPRRGLLKLVLAATVVGFLVAGLVLQYALRSGVSTAVGEQRTLNLEDGTRVELNTDTRLVVKYDRQMRTVVLKSGEAYFQVARELRPFSVIAGNSKILALGTAFTVRRDDKSPDEAVTVTLIEGRVAVAPVNEDPVLVPGPSPAVTVLNAGQRLRARARAKPTVDAPSIDKATGWMRGQLIFDHTPLREAAAEFSRYNKTKITIASPEAAEIPIGGIFRIGDSRSFARAVAASYDLKLTIHGDELVLESAQDPLPSTETAP